MLEQKCYCGNQKQPINLTRTYLDKTMHKFAVTILTNTEKAFYVK